MDGDGLAAYGTLTSSGDSNFPSDNRSIPLSPPSDSLLPIRPEPRRAYNQADEESGDRRGVTSNQSIKDKKSLLLLQQAANYASLAKMKQTNASNHTTTNTRVDAGALPIPLGATSGLVRRLSRGPFRNLIANRAKRDAPLTLLDTPQDGDDVEGDDAPRLSISSTESSGGSEVKTPESLYAPSSFLDLQAEGSPERIQKGKEQRQRQHLTNHDSLVSQGNGQRYLDNHHQRPSRSIFPYPDNDDIPQDLLSTSLAEQRGRSHRLMTADYQNLMLDRSNSDDNCANTIQVSTPSTQSRTSTIRAKRPDSLLRLDSTRTDDTARPSPPSSTSIPSTAGPSPAASADNAFGKARDPMNDAVVTESGHGLLSSSYTKQTDDLAQQVTHAFDIGSPSQPTTLVDKSLSYDLNSNVESTVASDSWRSLLPDNDPFFISSETMSSGTSSRAPSFAAPTSGPYRDSLQRYTLLDDSTSVLGDDQLMAASLGDKEGRRLSSESLQSSFSLAGPTAASIYASSNASGSQYDMDGTFTQSGNRAAFAPLQYQHDLSSKNFASPLLQQTRDRDFARSNSVDERKEDRVRMADDSLAGQDLAGRRHSSFSAFDSPSGSHSNNPISYSPLIHFDHQTHSRLYNHPAQVANLAATKAISPERRSAQYRSMSSAMSPSSPASSSAMGNEGDRESWPSSRTSLQGWQSDVANAATAAIPRNYIQVIDPYFVVNKKLSDGLQQTVLSPDDGSVETVPSLLAMSTNTTERDAPGLPADHRLLTTTTVTTLTSTTTTLVATSPKTSVAASLRQQQQQNTPQKPAYDVGPLSPASLPFLESRVARKELKVETHPTHYTLKTELPGFDLNGITLAIKHHRQLVIVADNWDEYTGGHFERQVTFGTDADLRATKANFDGTLLKITVPRVIH